MEQTKLESRQALILSKRAQFILLNETHTRVVPAGCPPETPDLPGYRLFDSPRLLPTRKPSGGVCTYVRDDIAQFCEVWSPTPRSSTGDVLWLKFSPPTCPRPLLLANIYSCPTGPCRPTGYLSLDDFWAEFYAQVEAAHVVGDVLIGGDLNAHINDQGAASDDRVYNPPGLNQLGDTAFAPPRKIIDPTRTNRAGSLLLTLCRDLSMLVVNGRAEGDVTPPCPTRNNAVLDYWIASSTLFEIGAVARLDVCSHTCTQTGRVLSDHYPVLLTLSLPNTRDAPQPRPAPRALPTYELQEARRNRFAVLADRELNRRKFTEHVAAIDGSTKVTACLDMLCDIALSVASRAMKPKPRRTWKARNEWYDEDCRAARKTLIHNLARTTLKLERTRLRREYDLLLKRKAREFYAARAQQFAGLLKEDPRKFCQRIRPRPPAKCPVALTKLKEHFERLNIAPTHPATYQFSTWNHGDGYTFSKRTIGDKQKESLVAAFTPEDIRLALGKLKNHRSPDAQGLRAELLKWLLPKQAADSHPLYETLAALFSSVFKHGFPSILNTAHLIPLFKKGAREDAGNYRGIAIITVLAKLYATLLEQRLTQAMEKAGVRAPTQAGFRPGRSCADQIWTLQSLIELQTKITHPVEVKVKRSKRYGNINRFLVENTRKKGKGPLFCCFVDFSKAFDSVPRALLWARLKALGLPDEFIQAIELYYRDVKLRVRTDEGFSDAFPSESGVKQGCPLSPTLFGLFIDHFADFLPARTDNLPSVLFYADDIVLIGYSEAELHDLIHRLEEFCASTGMMVNREKTEVVIFRRSRECPALSTPFSFNGVQLKLVDEYRYLGFIFHAWKSPTEHGLEILIKSANRAAHFLQSRCRALHITDVPTIFSMFDMYVRPILLYGCEMWLPYLFTRGANGMLKYDLLSSSIEKVHTRFLRDLFHLPPDTPLAPMLWELGRLPVLVSAQKQVARFMWKLAVDNGARKRVYSFHYLKSRENGVKRTWTALIKDCLSYGFTPAQRTKIHSEGAFGSPGILNLVQDASEDAATRALLDVIHTAPPDRTLLHAYAQLLGTRPTEPHAPVLAPYFESISSTYQRTLLLKERLGVAPDDNRRQRHQGIKTAERTACPYCALGEVEDSTHRLLTCPRFHPVRASYTDLFPTDGPAAPTRPSLLNNGAYASLGLYLAHCRKLTALAVTTT